MSNSKLDYLQKYMQGHQESRDYTSEPLKKKKKKKKKVLHVNNSKIIEEDEILVKSSKNVENEAYENNGLNSISNNNMFRQNDENEDSENIDDQNINEEELPQFEDTDGNLRNLTEEQKKEIIRNGMKNQKQDSEQNKNQENQNKSSGKWVTVNEDKKKKNKRSNSSSSSSSSDSDSESDVRRRLDSSDSEDREDNQDEVDNILKKKLNNALAQGSDDDSDMNVKRKKRKDSNSSESSVDSLTKLRKKQKMNQNRTTVRNEFGQVIDINDLKNQVSKEDDLKLLQEAQISRFSKGMKQMNDKKEQEKEQQQILEGKFNNYDPKKEQELYMIKKERVGDTMGAIIKAEEEQKINKMKGGTVIQKKCPHIAPPNRFNIKPGHRWDGVDRSNGHEALIFANQNNKKRQYDEQYERHQRDM